MTSNLSFSEHLGKTTNFFQFANVLDLSQIKVALVHRQLDATSLNQQTWIPLYFNHISKHISNI